MIRVVLAVLLAGTPAMAEPTSLQALSNYVNALESAETRFTQYNSDGSRSAGTLYIKRPGRMRFEYDPPNDALVLANINTVAIFDSKSNAEPQQFPLKRTPLNLILGKNVDLNQTNMVFDHYETDEGLTAVVARDPENPDNGMIELFFEADPIELAQWVITDESGTKTGVELDALNRDVEFPNWFFSVKREADQRSQ